MESSNDKRVYSGYYTKCDGSQSFVVMVVTDVDTGEEVVIFQEHIYARNPVYRTMTKASFCEQLERNGKKIQKFTRQAKRPVDWGHEMDVQNAGFVDYSRRRKPRVWDSEEEAALHARRRRRHACNYYDYAKDLCEHYRLDLRIHNLCIEEKRYIGVDDKDDFKNLKEDLLFLKSCRKTVLAGFGDYFKERFFEGKSIRQYAAEHEINRGSVDHIQKKFLNTLAEALAERDKADGISRLYTPDPDDEEDDPFDEDD